MHGVEHLGAHEPIAGYDEIASDDMSLEIPVRGTRPHRTATFEIENGELAVIASFIRPDDLRDRPFRIISTTQ